jgi:hypothetical protein
LTARVIRLETALEIAFSTQGESQHQKLLQDGHNE